MNWNMFPWRSLNTRVTLYTLLIFLVGIWSLAFYASRMLREDMQRMLGEQQFSTASMLAAQVDDELVVRLGALEKSAARITPAVMRNTPALQARLDESPALQMLFNAGVVAIGQDGTAIAEVPHSIGVIGVNLMDRDHVIAALKEGKATIGRPVMGKKVRSPIVVMAVPVRDPQGQVIGALSGLTDLGRPNFLDQLSGSSYGKTGGYFLVAPQHRLIVTASDKTRVMESFPTSGTIPLIERRFQGREGSDVFVSPRGVEVLGSSKNVPVAGWYVAIAFPTEEAFAPIGAMQRRMLFATIILTLMAGGLTWWILRRQLAPMLATVKTLVTLSDTNQRPQPLPVAREDEVGELIGGFNRLLKTLEKREDALKESEERYRTLVEWSPEPIVVHRGGNLIYVNPSAIALFGAKSAQDLVGTPIVKLIHPDFRQDAQERIRSQSADGISPPMIEQKFLRLDGSIIDVEIQSTTIVYDGNAAIHSSIRDITGRKRTAAEIRMLSRALEQSPVSIVIADRAGNIEYVNPRFEEITGYTKADAVGRNPRMLKSGTTPAATYANLWKTIAQGGEWRGELCNRSKNGALFWEYAAISGLKDESGAIGHYIAVKVDLTEQKRMNKALIESEERHRLLFEGSHDALMTIAPPSWRFTSANQATLKLFRAASVRAFTDLDPMAVSPERQADGSRSDDKARAAISTAMRDGLFAFEWLHRRLDGSLFPSEVLLTRVDLGGEVFVQATVRDLTERKRLEEGHLQAQKLESLGTLAGGIAHDFNNILAAIRGNAELATQDIGPDHVAAESLAEIRKASARASELVRRIMAFGRPKDTRQEVVDLGVVVDEVLKLLRSTLPAGISLVKKYGQDTPQVLADAGQIHEAVVNLTTNAAYAIGSQSGTIEYRLDPVQVGETSALDIPGIEQGPCARLTVTDSGSGMDAATIERIFDAFYTTKPVGEGTGLGLSMVHGIMKSLGGAVTVQSEPGKGSAFALYFPAAGAGAVEPREGAPANTLRCTGQRVLFVDDEEALVFLANRVLSRLGHHVSSFTDPEKALAALRAHPQDFDIVVTDLSMPHMSGLDLAREALALRPGMPVLMTTGYIRAEDMANARAAGIRELILKPSTMDELGRLLDRLVRGEQQSGTRFQ